MAEEQKINVELPIGEQKIEKGNVNHGEGSVESKTYAETSIEKQSETAIEREALYQRITSPVSASSNNDDDSDAIRKDVDTMLLKKMDAESQVKHLTELASVKGVVYAVKVARQLDDFYVLDQVRDSLANKFYDSLKEKGLIKTD